MGWKEYFESFCDKSDEELIEIGQHAVAFMLKVLNDVDMGDLTPDEKEEKTFEIVMNIIGTFVNADETVEQDEYEFVLKLLGATPATVPFDAFLEIIGDKDEELEEILDGIIDSVTEEYHEDFREAVCDLGTAIAVYDGTINKPEMQLIAKYYSKDSSNL